MGPSNTQTHLGAFLAQSYKNLELISERVGESTWAGSKGEERLAIRCFPLWSLPDDGLERLNVRFQSLLETNVTSLPRPVESLHCCDHVVLVEQWVRGTSWKEAVLSRETAVEYAGELFDLLAELHERGLFHGSLTREHLLVEDSTARLKLLGMLSRLPPADFSPESELSAALELIRDFIPTPEFKKLQALTSGREISRRLGRMLSTVQPERSEPDLVGRDRFLERMNRARERGGLVTVEAPAGGGKTRLLQEWRKKTDSRFLWGKAAKEVAPSPFQLFQRPFTQIEAELTERESFRALLEREAGVTLPLEAPLSSENRLQRSTLVWLARLLRVLQSDRSTILVLEDVHWADDLTLHFIEYWSKNPGKALIVVSFRPDELAPEHPLQRLDCSRIKLPRLTDMQATRLLRSAQPTASKTLLESALKRSGGNPFLLLQFLRSGTTRGDFHQVRVTSLDEQTKESLSAAAVLGDEVPRTLLKRCLGREPALTQGVDQGILTFEDDCFRFTHDRFREACLALLESGEIARIHLQAAEFHAEQDPVDPYKVAYHYQLGGRADLGMEYALQAAESARAKHDLSTAVYYFQAALSGLGEQTASHRKYEIRFRLGDCYRLIGRYSASEECFREALPHCEEVVSKARIMQALGDVYFKQAELRKAREAIVEGLALLGERQPLWLPAAFLGQAVRLVFRSLAPRKAHPSLAEKELLKASLYNRLAYVGWFLEGPVASIWAHFCELNIAEQFGETIQLARAQANHAIAMSALPWWSRSLAYGKKARETARKVQDKWSEGQAGHFYGAALLGAGRLKEARAALLDARALLEETGDRWEENGVCYHLALAYYRLGAVDKATELAAKTQRVGVEINDRLAAGDNLFTWARARGGQLDRLLIEQENAFESPDLQRACELLAAEALVALREGEFEQAVARLEVAIAKYRKKRVQNLYAAPLPCWLATAERLLAQQASGKERSIRLARANKVADKALRWARKYQTNLPHALREKGLIALLSGKREKAREALLNSLREARRLGLGQEERISASLYHRFHWLLGPSEVARPSDYSDHLWLIGEGVEGGTGARQMEELLEAATRISHCLSIPTALHQLCRGCKKVLGEETRCAVVAQDDQGSWQQLSGDVNLPLPNPPRGTEDWKSLPLPLFERSALLLVSPLRSEHQSLLDFLVTVTVAVVDRAGRTASTAVLSHDLQHSTALLDQEASRLFQAREQLLLSERLALTGRLATGVVHDLSNLMMAITGGAEVLLLDLEPEDPRRVEISEILAAGKSSNQLLSHLSGLTRGEVLGRQQLDLNRRISETRPLLRSLCGPIVDLEFHLGEIPNVRFDPITLDRILLNLVMNARDAVKPGGMIQVNTALVEHSGVLDGYPCNVPPGAYCVISVEDDGTGIPEDILPRAFELHFTTKGKFGTGVGLATVLEMVQANGGFLTVITSPRGTTFTIYLSPRGV